MIRRLSGQTARMRLTRSRVIGITLAVVLAVPACSGSDSEETAATGADGTTTTADATGSTAETIVETTEPTVWLRTTTTLAPGQTPPPTVAAQERPTGATPAEQEAAEDLANCALGDKNCYEVSAVQVEWPGAQITGIDLRFADLTGADLRGADLTFALMSGAILNGANLSRAKLSGADLTGSDLSGANLAGADLSGADLRGAILTGAILDGADLTAVDYCTTVMPDGTMNDEHC